MPRRSATRWDRARPRPAGDRWARISASMAAPSGDRRSHRPVRPGTGDGHADLRSSAAPASPSQRGATGLRPIGSSSPDFATLAMEQIVNRAAKLRHMLGGETSVPLVMRMPAGSGTGAAAQHKLSFRGPVRVCAGAEGRQPATPADAKGLLLGVGGSDPVLVFEHKLLKMKGRCPGLLRPRSRADPPRAPISPSSPGDRWYRALEAAKALGGRGHLGRGHRPAHRPADRPCDDRRGASATNRQALCLRGRAHAGHRRRDQRSFVARARLRLSRRADPAAWRGRGADPLQSGSRAGGGAALVPDIEGGRAPAYAPGGL